MATKPDRPLAPPADLSEGLCVNDGDPSQWDGMGTGYARAVCKICPVRKACLDDAMRNRRGQDGMRAGVWFDEGRVRTTRYWRRG